MRREYHKWFSPALGRDMELLAFGHAGDKVVVFPTRCGRFYDYEDWGLVAAAGDKIRAGRVQLWCVDSVDAESFYAADKPPADRVRRHLAYEAYVLGEVLAAADRANPAGRWVAHGCSMGAYHAVNLAFRHPGRFGKVVALSGRYDLTAVIGDFRDLLDGHYDDTVYFHTPSHFVPNLSDEAILSQLRAQSIALAVGEDDPFADNTRRLSEALWAKGVWHALHVWPGRAHKAKYWRPMVAEYL